MREIENFEGEEGAEGEVEFSEEDQKAWESFLTRGIEEELAASDPIRKNCEHVCFVSSSKGRGRRRKHPVEVELVRYNGEYHLIIPGYLGNGIDNIATEILGDSVDPREVTRVFLERLRTMQNKK